MQPGPQGTHLELFWTVKRVNPGEHYTHKVKFPVMQLAQLGGQIWHRPLISVAPDWHCKHIELLVDKQFKHRS